MATKHDVEKLSEIFGVPVKDLGISMGMNSGGSTPYLSFEGMTPELATKFIDNVLVPLRDKIGLSRDDLGFSEGGKGLFGGAITASDVSLSIYSSERTLQVLESNQDLIRMTVGAFLSGAGITTKSPPDVQIGDATRQGTVSAAKSKATGI